MLLLLLAACAGPVTKPAAVYGKTDFTTIPHWNDDEVAQVWPAWLKSCEAIARKKPEQNLGPDARWGQAREWQKLCDAARTQNPDPRTFFETHFTPVSVRARTSLFTGYYEASLAGSLTKSAAFQTPVYGLPRDFVTADLGEFSPQWAGKTIKGRVVEGKFIPYLPRAGIENAPLDAPVLAWVDDPVALFFMHVQGSGRIRLNDGRTLRIGYAEQNGHAYVAIGNVLKERGALETVTMQTIRAWLAAHPQQAKKVLQTNPSYVFFRVLPDGDGPIGAQNVALTPLRSIAIDKSLYAYGMPFFVVTQDPPLHRLMIAQDTGGAIKGPVRADIFWGYGAEAEARSGPMQSPGSFWLLLPNTVALALP